MDKLCDYLDSLGIEYRIAGKSVILSGSFDADFIGELLSKAKAFGFDPDYIESEDKLQIILESNPRCKIIYHSGVYDLYIDGGFVGSFSSIEDMEDAGYNVGDETIEYR